MPVQRIPRYSLLLRELEKQMDQYDDLDSMSKAIDEIKKVANFMNDKLKLFDSKKKMQHIQQRLELSVKVPSEGTPTARLISDFKNKEKRASSGMRFIGGLFKKNPLESNVSTGNLNIAKTIEKEVSVHNIIEPYRNYVSEGILCHFSKTELESAPSSEILKKSEKLAFLFSDMIMFCDEGPVPDSLNFLFEIKVEIGEFLPWVRDLTDVVFQVITNKTYTFIARNKEEKTEWISKFTSVFDKLIEVFPDSNQMLKCPASWTPKFVYDIRTDLFEIEEVEKRKFELDQQELTQKIQNEVKQQTPVPQTPIEEFGLDHFQHLNLQKYEEKRSEKKKIETRVLEESLAKKLAQQMEEKERMEREKEEKDRKERDERERLFAAHQERLEREKQERLERLQREKEEQERLELENQERIRLEKEKLERERVERVEKAAQEQVEREQRDREEKERLLLEKEEQDKAESERLEREEKLALEQERLEKERIIREKRTKKEGKTRKSIDKELTKSTSQIFEKKKTAEELIKIVEEKEFIKIGDQPQEVIDRLVALYLDQNRDQSKRLEYCKIIDDIKKKKFKKK